MEPINNGVLYNTGVSQDAREVKNNIPDFLSIKIQEQAMNDMLDETIENKDDLSARPSVPIYELKADEDARQLLQQFKDDADYEELVKYVKKWRVKMSGDDDTPMDHRALAVLLDDRTMFAELKRSHKMLDDTYSYLTGKTNMWPEHEETYDKIIDDIKQENEKCEEARQMLDRLWAI